MQIFGSTLAIRTIAAKDGELLWTYTGTNYVNTSEGPGLAADGSILIRFDGIWFNDQSIKGRFLALDATGALQWETPISLGPLTVGIDGTIYAQQLENPFGLFAFGTNGRQKWVQKDIYDSRPMALARDGTLFVCALGLNAIDPQGTLRWKLPETPSFVAIGPDGTLYAIVGTELRALTQDGILKWSCPLGAYSSLPTIGEDGMVYLLVTSLVNAQIMGITPEGVISWIKQVGSEHQNMLIDPAGNLVFPAREGSYRKLVSLEPKAQQVNWSYTIDAPNVGSIKPAIAQDGTIYFGAGSNFYAIDSLGREKWRLNDEAGSEDGWSPPAIATNGTIYVTKNTFGSLVGKVLAISGSVPPAKTGWPELLHDSAHSSSQERIFQAHVLGSSVTMESAVIDAAVRIQSRTARAFVEYGSGSELNLVSPLSQLSFRANDQTVRFTLSNLLPAQIYSYRIRITNETEAVDFPVQTFMTGGATDQIPPRELDLRSALLTGGTITFSNSGNILLTAPLEVRKDTIINATNLSVTIDGQGTNRLFYVFPGVKFELLSVQLKNGADRPARALTAVHGTPAFAGAILNEGFLTIRFSSIVGCSALGGESGAARGGAILNRAGTIWMQDVLVRDCLALGGPPAWLQNTSGDSSGGAIFNDGGNISLTNVTFTKNIAGISNAQNTQFSGPAFGGAIASSSGINIFEKCRFYENKAVSYGAQFDVAQVSVAGGALYNKNGRMWLINCSLEKNALLSGRVFSQGTGNAEGGAVFNSGEVIVEGSSFVQNLAQARETIHQSEKGGGAFGGALFNSGQISVANSTFFRNVALYTKQLPPPNGGFVPGPAYGGGVYNAGSGGLTNSTLTENRVVSNNIDYSGILPAIRLGANVYSTTNSFALKNSILNANAGETNFAGEITDAGNNISSDKTPIWTKATSKNETDPGLGIPGFYSGNTTVIPLVAGSSAIDAGENLPFVVADQRGHSRPFGTASDIGAFELSPPYTFLAFLQSQESLTNVQIRFNNTSFALSGTNQLELSGFPAGAYRIVPSTPNAIFSPTEQLVDLRADAALHFKGYRSNAFTAELSGVLPSLIFAGASNATYRVQSSTNFLDWRTIIETNLSSEILEIPVAWLTNRHEFFRLLGP